MRRLIKATSIVLALAGASAPAVTSATEVDLDTGNAAIEVVIPSVLPVLFSDVSPSGGDAPLVLRITTLLTNAWFDATAPYHETAVGVYTRLGRQPPPLTNRDMNVALLYASYRVLLSLLPPRVREWRDMLAGVGLDPDDGGENLATAVGIGNAAGRGVVEGRERDGMNQLGDEDDRTHNRVPYADYTGYRPLNSAYRLRRAGRWQPDLQRQGLGIYKVQQFVTPQYAQVEPYAYDDPASFSFPPPLASLRPRDPAYREQADEVLRASAELDERRKLAAELFDDKIQGLGFSAVFAARAQGLSLLEFVQLDFLTNMAAHDAGIAVWTAKRRYDAVRPFSAIGHIYGASPVVAWGGVGKGTVSLPANEWKSYLEEADHPEYPSASTCFCHAHAQAARRFLPWGDSLDWTVSRAAGSSRVEPGITPAADLDLHFATWSDFARDCGQSRVWAGVHFQAAVDESAARCDTFGDLAHDYLDTLLAGTAAERGPSRRTGEDGHGH